MKVYGWEIKDELVKFAVYFEVDGLANLIVARTDRTTVWYEFGHETVEYKVDLNTITLDLRTDKLILISEDGLIKGPLRDRVLNTVVDGVTFLNGDDTLEEAFTVEKLLRMVRNEEELPFCEDMVMMVFSDLVNCDLEDLEDLAKFGVIDEEFMDSAILTKELSER